jgi:hypothetical protein
MFAPSMANYMRARLNDKAKTMNTLLLASMAYAAIDSHRKCML